MSDDELLAAIARLRIGRVLAKPTAFAAGAVLLVIHGVLLLFTNWRLMVIELFPALWLAAVFWDWRFHVLYGNDLVELRGPWAIVFAVAIPIATVVSYACNLLFSYLATGAESTVSAATRRCRQHVRLVVIVGLAVGGVHAWVSVRGSIRGFGTFALGLGLVAVANLYLYSALPAQALGLDRRRADAKGVVTTALVVGALSLVVSAPGITLALAGRVLVGVPVLRILGVVVLAVAVLLQIAAASSSRAVSLWATVSRATPAGGDGPVTER